MGHVSGCGSKRLAVVTFPIHTILWPQSGRTKWWIQTVSTQDVKDGKGKSLIPVTYHFLVTPGPIIKKKERKRKGLIDWAG